MKKTIVITEAENFMNLNPQMQRMMILSNSIFKYIKTFQVISDINGKGWFAGQYSRRPYMSKNGNIYYKTNCQSSITYKNGKIWGNMSQSVLLHILATNVSQFEFLKDCEFITSNRITFPEHVVKSILSGKITSQEDMWKAVAKKSYKNKHWKIVRFCKQNYIPIMLLELGCRDWEAILDLGYTLPYIFNSLLRAACIVGEKVSCKWSEKRMEEEYKRLSRSVKLIEIESKDNTPVYDLSNIIDIGYTIVNTERDAFDCSEAFHNCVYSNYWNRIKDHRYLVVHNDTYCVGYQVINRGEDLLLDQIHTIYNGSVTTDVTQAVDRIVKPVLYELIRQIPKEIPGELGRIIIDGWPEL